MNLLLDSMIRGSRRRTRAAGIATVDLRCHADTWRLLHDIHDDFVDHLGSLPTAGPADETGMVTVRLSGLDLVRLLLANSPRRAFFVLPAAKAAVARRAYAAVAAAVDQVDGPSGQSVPPIVLDDRLRPAG